MTTKDSNKRSKKGFAMLAIAGGALSLTIGGVFAANSISINGDKDIEFGQGVAAASSCDAGLTTSISQTYNIGDGHFYANQVTVGGIKDFACDGKTLHISLVDSENVVCGVAGNTTGVDAFTITDGGTVGQDDDTSVVVDLSASSCRADSILKVAITTS